MNKIPFVLIEISRKRLNYKISYIIPFSIQTIFPKSWRWRIFQTTPRLFHQTTDRFTEIDNTVIWIWNIIISHLWKLQLTKMQQKFKNTFLKNHTRVKKVRHTSEFLFGIYWWNWKTNNHLKNCWSGSMKNKIILIFTMLHFF